MRAIEVSDIDMDALMQLMTGYSTSRWGPGDVRGLFDHIDSLKASEEVKNLLKLAAVSSIILRLIRSSHITYVSPIHMRDAVKNVESIQVSEGCDQSMQPGLDEYSNVVSFTVIVKLKDGRESRICVTQNIITKASPAYTSNPESGHAEVPLQYYVTFIYFTPQPCVSKHSEEEVGEDGGQE